MFISFFFLSLVFNRYILFVSIYTASHSLWVSFSSSFFFIKKNNNSKTYGNVFYVTCISIILTLWSWGCLFNLNEVAKIQNKKRKEASQPTTLSHFHLNRFEIQNISMCLIKFETNANIFGRFIYKKKNLPVLFRFDYPKARLNECDCYCVLAIVTRNRHTFYSFIITICFLFFGGKLNVFDIWDAWIERVEIW